MSNLLHRNTNRCKLIKDVSKEIWDDIIEMHSTGQDSSEIYYTKKLISRILSHTTALNYSIWAREPGMEKNWGCDIDIFIERGVNDFILYAFQAKLLKLGQVYSDLDRFTNGSYQYQKLLNYGYVNECYTNYLFYNGVANYHYSGTNKCDTKFDESQFGVSYVDISKIKSVIGNRVNWNFQYFHPCFASPLSELVCCRNKKLKNIKSYGYQEIMKKIENYPKFNRQDVEAHFEKVISYNSDKEFDNSDQKSKREAEIVIVIRNTTSTF